ncbi:DUF2716 domain-containing protein [Paenilisteria rocourtiae]|uniref:Uncharacterized protein DUF2716 n=1 Tax=Listeria rocourtiae TaxID=647910 RepID=A0A4R6ZLE2_9LIST|nr:DUF2716 domain-containing protein [Listeria rocourtiae]EUJ51046.1 hypothetical protein PROCOU_03019 [Listeria rocourtiae FSL F6-920]MBC1604351.1 DUF2716 domain-containing protein [Listeria rocourtiae]TDR52914.1 uncharacterized protein DUF2716 [Listeria rocourtiae]
MMRWYEIEHYRAVDDKFHARYKFKPSPSIFAKAIKPRDKAVVFKEYKIRKMLTFEENDGLTQAYLDGENWTKDLFLRFFGEEMYALDWYHVSYRFLVDSEYSRGEFGEWCVPFLPDGDYYFFLNMDMSLAWLGHPWRNTVTVVGAELVSFIEENGCPFLE